MYIYILWQTHVYSIINKPQVTRFMGGIQTIPGFP